MSHFKSYTRWRPYHHFEHMQSGMREGVSFFLSCLVNKIKSVLQTLNDEVPCEKLVIYCACKILHVLTGMKV